MIWFYRQLKLAHETGCRISIDLASFNIVEENLEFLNSVGDKYVDIIFANEEEARAFTGLNKPEAALEKISEKCDIAIVKTGKDGSLIKRGNAVNRIQAIKADAMDTTGAGDLYAAGFFFRTCQWTRYGCLW